MLTHAWPSLPVNPDPNSVPPGTAPSRLNDTAAAELGAQKVLLTPTFPLHKRDNFQPQKQLFYLGKLIALNNSDFL